MEISNAESIKQVKSVLKSASRVFILTGAGISAESGVPTFRGGGGAPVWRGMPFEELSSAEMVEKDLPLVWEWFDYRRGLVSKCEPSAAHETLAYVQQSEQFEEFVIATQNIDGLHAAAGAESVIELHGSLRQTRCLNCRARKDLREIPAATRPPICDKCSSPMRPDVILFGEAMPIDAFAQAKFFAEVCDVCIVIGTSVLVNPAAELPLIAKQMGAKIIEINPEETSLTAQADLSIRGKAAEILPLIFVEKDGNDDHLPTSETVKNTAEQNRNDFQTESPNGELETESLPAENQPIPPNEMTSDSHPLRVDFVQSEEFSILNRLGMTFAPGKKQKGAVSGNWNRNMYRDMVRLREHYAVDLQVSLLEEEEFDELGLNGFEGQSQRRGISLIEFPIRDASVPTSMKSFAKVIREIVRQLNDEKKVVVHCKEGLGRTGLTVACAIVAASRSRINSTEAIKMVRQARPGTVETSQQENFVALFEEYWQIYSERIESLLYQKKKAVSEKILEIKSKGLIERLFRFPTYDGRYFFYLTVQHLHIQNTDNYDWEAEPVPTFREALDLLSNHYQFVPYKMPFIHREYRAEFKSFLEKINKNLSGSFTFEEWLAGVDDPTAPEHTASNSSDDNQERVSNIMSDWSERPVRSESEVDSGKVDLLRHEPKESVFGIIVRDEDVRSSLQNNSLNREATGTKRKLIEIYLNQKLFDAKTIPELYKKVLVYLADEQLLDQVSMPIATGEKRYILAKEPIHPTGKPFLAPVEYAGYFMEAHNNRTAAIAQLKRFVESLQVDFEVSEVEVVNAGSRLDVNMSAGAVTTQKSNEERYQGCLLGMAVGDALGTTVEFMSPGSFQEITSISGGGPFGLNPGEWTDDTSMALCLADSLIKCKEFNAVDQMQRYCQWKNEGYLSSNGMAFDIGVTVRTALENFEGQSGDELNPFCGSTSPSKAGNGSLMRLAPVVLFYADDPKQAISFAAESSRTTHGAREAVDACRYFAALIIGALQGKSKEELLSAHFTPVKDLWEAEPLSPKIAEIARGSFKDRKPPQIIGSSQGYVVLSLHAALWAFYHTDNFKDGALKVVNLGYDADTYGAIYGQLAGAFYGKEAIPANWLDVLAQRDLITSFAGKLCEANADNINTE